MASPPEHAVGDAFPLQFVWQIPSGDFLRAIFSADVEALDTATDRYIVRLAALTAARQENSTGETVPVDALDQEYWPLVKNLVGRKAAIAYETAGGRPIRLRLPTLTLEHPFFTRISD